MTQEQSSPQGRGILLAIVNGEVGERIQQWREARDPGQARRYPPHATLCYWVPDDASGLDAQVAHAFPTPIRVRLGGPHIFDNPDRTMYVEVQQHEELDAARARLVDGTHLTLPTRDRWTWHVTCLRRTVGIAADVIEAARRELLLDCTWEVDEIAHLQLDGDGYRRVATWRLG
jgi:2'-5' RNA ligase